MKITPRHVARLAAIQAVFQSCFHPDLEGEHLLETFLTSKFTPSGYVLFDQEDAYPVDEVFFKTLLKGALDHQQELDLIIQKALSAGRTPDRLDITTLSVLRCGTFELHSLLDVPVQVILSEYVTAGHFFLSPKGPGFVNGVLSALGHTLRGDSRMMTEPQ